MSDAANSVELIPIESKTRTIQTCFQQCLYEVPNFQRPYSWSSDQLEDFWDDVVLAQGDFFFGSTVTWVSEKRELFNDTYSIIDGQQRLTTSAIILSVLRDAFNEVAKRAKKGGNFDPSTAENQAAATQRYLIASDDDGSPYPVLKRSEPMFYEHIQNPSAIPSGVEWNSSAKRIGEARTFFEKRIIQELDGLSVDAQVERLKTIRANVLKARVIQVELASEEDGFLIFETLNTRGADLRLSDLIKNLLIRGGAANVPDRQAIAQRWERVADRVQDGRLNPDVADRFIWQSWNSRRVAVKEPELFKEINSLVDSNPAMHLSYLKELEVDSQVYECLEDEDVQVQAADPSIRNAFAVPEFVDSVRSLAIFNVSVANSTMLAIARRYQENRLVKRSQLIEVARLVENFHFQFTALTNSGSTGGTRGRYNRFAARLEAASSDKEVAEAILDLRTKLRNSLPSRDQTEKAFRELFYAPSLQLTQAQKIRARKIFIAYVLMAFAKSNKLIPAGQNLKTWSIEHIKPQALGSDNYKDPVYSIGNLTLLTSALNSELGKAPLPAKVEALRKGNAYFDSALESWASSGAVVPSDEQINKRSELLAVEALDRVWSL
ncbi:DUF262 domain-containing protein [Nocardia nova]|uniref:DUF262 domain-containing protein n=1 Tax=Nocardia nova TaxID=37330 RepID=UPI000CE9EEF2|nr:DUF262 domain-containing protein [Nocardia nova]PPI95406.1 DUF262 domain-containing protein [Nocardia nova]